MPAASPMFTKGATSMLPRRRFTIQSALPPEQARSRLMGAIGPARTSVLQQRDSRPFTGSMTGAAFSITRASQGRNSFRPLIRGSVEPAPGGTRVEGTMRLHQVVVLFMGFLILAPGWLLLNILPNSITTGRWDMTILAIPGAMVFLVSMMGIGFAWESRRALKDLAAIVEGEPSAG